MIGKRVLNSELTQSGIPVYSANVYEPFGFINKDVLKDFSKPSVLWGIDGDWMVNTIPENISFYPTDHTGVLRINTDKINYRCLAYKLEQNGRREGFSRNYRASIGQIKKMSITLPSIEFQNKVVEDVKKLEKLIVQEEKNIKIINLKKADIITKHILIDLD